MSLGVQDSHIVRLTATAPNNTSSEPTETPAQWPTYENIVNALQKLSQTAQPGDTVYLHYSGHGARVATIFEGLKGSDGLDEALVPTNIQCARGRYIRDVEIAYLLQEMVKKELVVTVVLDCCHSGSANRNGLCSDAGIRGIATVDRNKLDTDVSAFSYDDLSIAMKDTAPNIGRKARVVHHWLLEPRGYAFLAACRAHEVARELEYGGRVQGVLTHSLLSTLKNNSQGLTHHMLWELVAPKVREQSCQQNVVLGGEGDRLFFSGDRLKLFHTSTVIKVHSIEGRTTARLNAGRAHGVSVGMEFDVWPVSCSAYSDSKRVGRLKVTAVEDLTADTVTEPLVATQQLEVGCQALPRTTLSLQRPVRLLYPKSIEENAARKALDLAREAWKEHGTTFAPLVDESDSEVAFQVQVKDGAYDILDRKGRKLQHTIPPLPIDADRAAEKLMRRLTHLANYFNVLDLKNQDEPWVSVGIKKKPFAFPKVPIIVIDPPSTSPPNQRYEATDSEWLVVQIRNKSASALNITVLDLDSSWAINQIYPFGGAAYETLDSGKTLYLPLEVATPDGVVSEVLDTIKVFATVEVSSFRWLELAELDGHSLQRNKTSNRGNALELLQATIVRWEPTTRKATPCAPLGWDVGHVTVRPRDAESNV
ncbi:hypothetical protein F5Y03DRAFT_359546 [Xylaria venustula]|nr:hypothetical protein F5Y03DRAFT_359546 [Xylaria venustula]